MRGALQVNDSWWKYWSAWLKERGNGELPSNPTPGSSAHPPICLAPGTYVFD